MNDQLNTRLDDLQERLPAAPSNLLRLNRAVARGVISSAATATRVGAEAAKGAFGVVSTGAKTVLGTSRSAAEDTGQLAAKGVRRVKGQASAEAEQAFDAIAAATENTSQELAEKSERLATAVSREELSTQTRSELYDRAQELDIEGRSSMNKDELVDALLAE